MCVSFYLTCISIVIIIILDDMNSRKLRGDKVTSSNGIESPMPMKDRKRIKPINAFEAEDGHTTI